jgi:hypothetical protein
MRTTFAFLFIIQLVIAGCAGVSEESTVPEWVKEPPVANSTKVYGVFVAATEQEAFKSAAAGLVSSVYKAAKTTLETIVTDEHIKSQADRALKAELSSLDYTGISIKETKKIGEDTAVLVSMDRQEITVQLKRKIDEHIDILNKSINTAKTKTLFIRLAMLGKAHEERPKLIAEAALLKTIDPEADTKYIFDFTSGVEADYDKSKFEVSAGIISDAGSIYFVQPLKKAFAAEGIKPSGPDKKHTDGSNATILLASDKQQEKSAGKYRLKIHLRINTKVGGITVATKEHIFTTASTKSYHDATQQAASLMTAKIHKDGVFHILGF